MTHTIVQHSQAEKEVYQSNEWVALRPSVLLMVSYNDTPYGATFISHVMKSLVG
jgi:hypothetical protein